MSRWASARSSDCVSCWPCKSTSRAPSWASTPTVVGLPLTQARERPSGYTSRFTTKIPSAESSPSVSTDGRTVGQIERALDHGLLRAGPHHIRRGALPEQQREGVDEHGLPRAGLAGQDVEAGLEGERHVRDHGKVADA